MATDTVALQLDTCWAPAAP